MEPEKGRNRAVTGRHHRILGAATQAKALLGLIVSPQRASGRLSSAARAEPTWIKDNPHRCFLLPVQQTRPQGRMPEERNGAMVKDLPAQPNISQLRRQARDLQKYVRSGEADSIERVRTSHPNPPKSFADFGLREAQLTMAREYGFKSWHDLATKVGEMMVDVRDLDRWFGIELNNEVWTRIDAASVTPESAAEDREHLLYSAYASALHWRNSGTVANVARGEHLIARAAIVSGEPEVSLQHANRCLQLVEANPEAMEDWDRAFALEALSRAKAAAGDMDGARATRALAEEACAAVSDPEDRAIVEEELQRPPWFGLL